MEAAPAAPFEMPEPDLLLEFLIVALDAPAQLGDVDQRSKAMFFGKRREPVFGRLVLAFGPLDQQPFFGVGDPGVRSRCATRTRTRAKREDSASAVPSRHSIVRQARFGRPSASSLTETADAAVARSASLSSGPTTFAGSGPVPGAHTSVLRQNAGDIGQDPDRVMPVRKSVSTP